MIRRLAACAVVALAALVTVVAWAQQKGQTITVGGVPYLVDRWNETGLSQERQFDMISPNGRRPWTSVSLRVSPDGSDSCKMSAVCINYDINRSTGQTFKRERNCTLTVDPQRQTLSESGSTLSYSRTPRGPGRGGEPGRSITAPPAEAPASAPAPSAQDLAEIATRERLNREQAAFSAKQVAENAAAKVAYDKATAERVATIVAQTAEQERKEREYQAAMAKWRADVEACNRGEISRCGPQ